MISNTVEWSRLEEHAQHITANVHLRELLADDQRCGAFMTEHNGILLDYSRQLATLETMDMLFDLASAVGLEEKRNRMGSGLRVNNTEDRAVMHIALRSPRDKTFCVDGEDVVPAVHKVLDDIAAFSQSIRSGTRVGATGKQLKNVVCIGIGGSYLGPEFVYEALRTDGEAVQSADGRTLRFLANVDPLDIVRAICDLDPENTLVVIISKTFTTAETMLNARAMRQWLVSSMNEQNEADVIAKHMVAVSSAIPAAVEFGIAAENIFGFWDWVGGRYSVCSAVGMLPLSLHYGFDVCERFLAGAHAMDVHFFEAPARENLPILLGLLGVWNSSFLKFSARALLPYSQALVRFAAHIQQVDMESNGKRVTADGEVLPFAAGEIIFGEPGTNGQHSFYQLLHQGRTVPAEFIGFCQSPQPLKLPTEQISNHDELMSNFFAQPDALAYGKTQEELAAEGVPPHLIPHKEFPGNRPSLSLLFDELTPYTLGQLLVLYEHRVAVQGFIWGLNSFDQWGVELGKKLAATVRDTLATPELHSSSALKEKYNASTAYLLGHFLSHKK